MFNKTSYISSGIWLGNDHLVHPENICKRCVFCNRLKFTIEFIDCDFFIDGKIPVCLTCFHARTSCKRLKVVDTISAYGFQKECRKCGKSRNLTDYHYNKKTFGLQNKCVYCKRERKVQYNAKEKRKEPDHF